MPSVPASRRRLWNPGRPSPVREVVPDWFVDLLLPPTDRAATIQWVVAALFWAVAIPTAWRAGREVGLLAIGLALCTFAWFLLRMAH